MYRSGFEKVCDAIAGMQTSLGETTQWVLTAFFAIGTGTLLMRSMTMV